jgi:DNA-binding NarL/FixJ family response regulator
MALVLDGTVKNIPIQETLIPFLGKIGTYCLIAFSGSRGKSSSTYSKTSREPNGDELTSRQIKILELMSDGMVNLEIARELMLSESTIRQETVRIYKALGVPNRSEAASKGRSLGLINSNPSRIT